MKLNIKFRIFYTLLAWLSAGLVYLGCSLIKDPVWIVPETATDALIPFSSTGIWLYLSFYIYIPYTFFTIKLPFLRLLMMAFIITSLCSGIIFILVPTSINYPEFHPENISGHVLYFISRYDTPLNCFPSMHASLIGICTFANVDRKRMGYSVMCIVLTLIMYYAIIQVRRHVFIDLAAGVILAGVVWAATHKVKVLREFMY